MARSSTTFQKGHIGIGNVFKKGHCLSKKIREKIKKAHLGKELSVEHKIKISKGLGRGNEIHNWKGDKVGYYALHAWISREKGSAKLHECIDCGSRKNLEWSNIDHKYRRKLEDYKVRCKKCHVKFDKLMEV